MCLLSFNAVCEWAQQLWSILLTADPFWMACWETNVTDWRLFADLYTQHLPPYTVVAPKAVRRSKTCVPTAILEMSAAMVLSRVTRDNYGAGLTRHHFLSHLHDLISKKQSWSTLQKQKVQHMAMAFEAPSCLFPGLKRTTMLLEQEEIRAREWRKKKCYVHVCCPESSYKK